MKLEEMKLELVGELLSKGFHCSQATLYHYAEVLGMDPNLALKVSTGLGGGCFNGGTCGAVAGPVMALSLIYGFDLTDDAETVAANNGKLMVKVQEFQKRFSEKYGSPLCKEILGGYSWGDPEDTKVILEKGLSNKCVQLCKDACDILDEMLKEDGIIE